MGDRECSFEGGAVELRSVRAGGAAVDSVATPVPAKIVGEPKDMPVALRAAAGGAGQFVALRVIIHVGDA